MIYTDNLNRKIMIFILSVLICGIMILLYFLDTSLDWGTEKIISCILVNLWLFFIIPSLRRSWLVNKDKGMEDWIITIGYYVVRGFCLPILLAPFFGVKYYFIDCYKEEV